MSLQAILIDVDGTITDPLHSSMDPQMLWCRLEELLMAKKHISRKSANARILSCGDCETHCLSEFLDELDIAQEDYFAAICRYLKNKIVIPDDTKRFLEFVKREKIALYTATTNPRFVTLAKLAAGGVAANHLGCEYFTGYYSGCFFRDREGKFSPRFYPDILKHGNFSPDRVMMIGDEPHRDMLPACRAGIKYGINIDRTRKEPLIEKNGGYFINSMDVLHDFIRNIN